MIWALVAVTALSGGEDPRIEIARAQLAGDPAATLALVDSEVASATDRKRIGGLTYLRGHLLEELGQPRAAHAAFAAALAGSPELAAHSRFRLALNESRRGHPEVAAGLLATLLGRGPPKSLVAPAVRLLFQSLERGGDCRLVRGAERWKLDADGHRLLAVAAAACAAQPRERRAAFFAILAARRDDEAARLVADRLTREADESSLDARELMLLGLTLKNQRSFEQAARLLGPAAEELAAQGDSRAARLEARYALARSLFWRELYLDAAAEFGRVAALSQRPSDSARALYQQGRSFELDGSWQAAGSSFRLAYLEDPAGRWADAALLSALRLEWRQGNQGEALRLFEVLSSRREWTALSGRAALFLASSEIALGRTERSARWLAHARRADRAIGPLADYWSGRLAELENDWPAAAEAYAAALGAQPFTPVADLASSRLSSPELAAAGRNLAARLARRQDTRSLYTAWLLSEGAEDRERLHRVLGQRYEKAAAGFFAAVFVDPADWPLWNAELRAAEEQLLALGLWSEGATAIPRHFPPTDIRLGYTGSRLLTRGGSDRRALQIAETLIAGARLAVPPPFVPNPIRRAAFPLPFGSLLAAEAARHEIDPYLLVAVVREESRFDPLAVSSAAARGLTQLVPPTAQRLAARAGRHDFSVEDLHDPATSIALGATYLAELADRFGPRPSKILAAYNAGERQAELWQSYCFTSDPAEYLSKVGFPETRQYLERVISSRNEYADIYPPATLDAQSSAVFSDPTTSGGTSTGKSSE